MKKLACKVWKLGEKVMANVRQLDFIAPLALRLFLVPVFWMAGTQKIMHIDSTAAWFGNPDWGLGLPFPYVMAYAAALTETLGALLLLFGLGIRLITPALIFVMLVAMFSVHWEHGWPAIAATDHEAMRRLSGFLSWLKQNYPQRHAYIIELGRPVILNNGIEFAVTYLVMLLSLFFSGAGKYLSLDYWIYRRVSKT